MEIPNWLQENNIAICPCGCIGKRSKKNYIEKTLYDLSKIIKETIYSEELANKSGLLQNLDPRVKIVCFIFSILAISLVHNPVILFFAYVGLIVLALLSHIPFSIFFKRVWLVVPLFTAIMLIPALFNWVRPGIPLVTLWDFGHPLKFGLLKFPSSIAITKQGVMGSVIMIFRVGNSISLALLLTFTTRWYDLLKAFRILYVPKVFITTMEMTYRYIFVLLNVVEEMFLARKARMLKNGAIKENRRFIGASIATLFGKAQAMSEEVYASMLARGYNGNVRTITNFRVTFYDIVAVLLTILFSMLLFVSDKALGGIRI